MNDLISVIIPVKNGSNYLKEAIKGILAQNMNIEIIVVDDASIDNTVEIAKSYGCKVIKHETTKGPVIAKNNGLKIAQGKYILFHDHDDVMTGDALKNLYNELASDTSVSAVQGKIQDFYSPEFNAEERVKTPIKQEPYWGLFSGAILMKKEIFDTIGLFSESITAGEILDWQSKMNSHGLRIKKLDFVSTMRRIHSTNFGKTNQGKEFKDYAAILRAKLKR